MPEPRFCLASQSPRRRELLARAGYVFSTDAADIDETPLPMESPQAFVCRMAEAKARHVAARTAGLPVLGADTDVALDGEILGKPLDREHGVGLLMRLSGRAHQVSSAVAWVCDGAAEVILSVTEVRFGELSRADAEAYWDSGEPADKAGGYAIQGLGARFVATIDGSVTGVVGLPLYETCALLARHGIRPAAMPA